MTNQPVRVPSTNPDPALDPAMLLVCMLDPPPPPVQIDQSALTDPLGIICLAKANATWQTHHMNRKARQKIGEKLRTAGAEFGEWWQIAPPPTMVVTIEHRPARRPVAGQSPERWILA